MTIAFKAPNKGVGRGGTRTEGRHPPAQLLVPVRLRAQDKRSPEPRRLPCGQPQRGSLPEPEEHRCTPDPASPPNHSARRTLNTVLYEQVDVFFEPNRLEHLADVLDRPGSWLQLQPDLVQRWHRVCGQLDSNFGRPINNVVVQLGEQFDEVEAIACRGRSTGGEG